jgi:DNA-binding NarL/FixJ family response regulator
MVKVLIYEDNTLLKDSLAQLIGGSPGFEVPASFEDCTNIVAEVEVYKPDVVLLDIDMPDINGIEALKILRKENSEVKILMLTVFDDDQNVFQAIKNGANGYLLKKTPPAKLLENITDVCNGGAPMTSSIARQVLQMFSSSYADKNSNYNLSERETETLKHLVNGFSYKMIAAEMHISIDTVRAHIKKIYEKLQVNSKGEAVAKAFKDKIV